MKTRLGLDWEGKSEAVLVGAKSVGVWNYMRHPTTKPLMLAWNWDGGPVEQVDMASGGRVPSEVIEAVLDPEVEKWAFNAAFERLGFKFMLGIDTPVRGWRCTMALSYMRSFNGGLGDVAAQLRLPLDNQKDKRGKELIKIFCQPQKPTKAFPMLWRDHISDMDRWDEFLTYNRQDVVAEQAIFEALIGYGVLEEEWRLYELDQEINDRGMPIDITFVSQAKDMAARRKGELTELMREVTSLGNPNSTQQLIPWLRDRGYPFEDLQKNTVKKVLASNKEGPTTGFLEGEAVQILRLRQFVSRASVKKYDAILRRIDPVDFRLRHCFQFAGAGRTNRWSGRGPQPQNLVRTPKVLEGRDGDFSVIKAVTAAIRAGYYEELFLLMDEPMDAFAGAIRSAFIAEAEKELVVCDLSAIESAVIAWLSKCERLLNVFRNGLDPYKDFGTELYGKPYDEITKEERNICKPPTLGCGFGLGGGQLREGKRTGLWGYAENMGVEISQAEAARQVALFRSTYKEIPAFWKSIEHAIERAVDHNKRVTVNGLLTFQKRDRHFMTMTLPSGRDVFYYRPKIMEREFPSKDGGTYTRRVFTHMGVSQITKQWGRVASGGPKVCENAVQATAREVLKNGMLNADEHGFPIIGSVHDEIIAERIRGSNFLSLENLRENMVRPKPWMSGLPLNAAGYVGTVYRKD